VTAVPGYGVGFSGLTPPDDLGSLAALAEEAGYDSVWVSVLADRTDPVDLLRIVSEATTTVEVGLGLVPLEAFKPRPLADAARRTTDRRINIMIGAGGVRTGAAKAVAAAVEELRLRAPQAEVGPGGYGERVLGTARRGAGGILLNWSSPEHARQAASLAFGGGTDGPARPRVHVYLPTAVGSDARQTLDRQLHAMAAHDYHREHQRAWGRDRLGLALADAYTSGRAELGRTIVGFRPHHVVILPVLGLARPPADTVRDLAPAPAAPSASEG
jgi:hypothetical protein